MMQSFGLIGDCADVAGTIWGVADVGAGVLLPTSPDVFLVAAMHRHRRHKSPLRFLGRICTRSAIAGSSTARLVLKSLR